MIISALVHRQLAGCLEVAIACRRKFLGYQAAGAEVALDGWEEVCLLHDVDDEVPQVELAHGQDFCTSPVFGSYR